MDTSIKLLDSGIDSDVPKSAEGHNVDAPIEGSPEANRSRGQYNYPERPMICVEAIRRLAAWSTQANERLRGAKLTRSDLANYLILSHPESLTPLELNELQARHFDEIKFVLWAVEEKKAAEARGDDITVMEIMAQNRPKKVAAPRARMKAKRNSKNSEKTREKE